jgi:hypothetical protein
MLTNAIDLIPHMSTIQIQIKIINYPIRLVLHFFFSLCFLNPSSFGTNHFSMWDPLRNTSCNTPYASCHLTQQLARSMEAL